MQKDDVIYRQAAVDALDVGKELLSCALDNMDIVGNDREKFEWGLGLIESYIDDIKDMPSAQPHWIPCSERLPEAEYGESDNVLTTCIYKDAVDGYRSVKTLYYNGGVWCYPTGETFEGKVLAWMPLPEPYGGESE